MIYPYPKVHDEFETIAAVTAGKSLARIGDGELKLILGGGAMREPPNPKLARELLDVMQRPDPRCIVGIPTLDPEGPKIAGWLKHAANFCRVLVPDVDYYSAFVSRPDSASRIETPEFAASVRALWLEKRVALVCEPDAFILRTVSRGAKQLVHIPCPHRETYAKLSWLEKRILKVDPQIAVLSCGPAATCLAMRLARNGVHAFDFGSGGRFIYRMLWPEEYQ